MLKQISSRELHASTKRTPFWQPRYYDFNVWSEHKRTEKLDYIHNNPVKRGLVTRPEEWAWSSARHYATGEDCGVEIESSWTARRREQVGVFPTVRLARFE
jgi:REP-associated tyrosine transposase